MNKIAIAHPLTLQVWQEDPRLIRGIPPVPDRPISYALLSFALENKTTQPQTLKIKNLEIRPVGSQSAFMSLPPKDLTLKPLEIAPQQYQFSARQGYGNIQEVEGIFIYEFEGKVYTLRSPISKVR